MDNLKNTGIRITPFRKVLIANRGEIALRIMGTLQAMGIVPVCVFAENDRDSYWVRQAPEAYSLGGGTVSETYLNIPGIMTVARQTGADAIHPGYGFLSENFRFAKACEDQNIAFIGPSSDTLKLMGDKISSYHFADQLGIPVLKKIVSKPGDILGNKESLEYPLLVKAAAGGGGRGMRIVKAPGELNDVLEATANEALHYFADERVFVEKYLYAPRHIEVQLMGDHYGNVIHLFERECSIQRRHQKIIEEAPASALPEELRQQILDTAVKIGIAAGYRNAGTIEFLIGNDGGFYFLEMNPRIQVEHGITEMITGMDIVREQIRIAEGHPLAPATGYAIKKGHAIEARIYAEDPENELLPSPGTLYFYREPQQQGVRIDSAVRSGSVIHPDYDPLIAKIMVHEATREEAVGRLKQVLGEFVITGVAHNIPLIRAVLDDSNYLRNEITTSMVSQRMQEISTELARKRKEANPFPILAAAALVTLQQPERTEVPDIWKSIGYWRIVPRISFAFNGTSYEVEYSRRSRTSFYLSVAGHLFSVDEAETGEFEVNFILDGQRYTFYRGPDENGVLELSDKNCQYPVELCNQLQNPETEEMYEEEVSGDGVVRSPLPGKVTRIAVSLHDSIAKGDKLLVIESMKLENSILAPCSGIIRQIAVGPGDQVKQHTPLVFLKSIKD